MRPPSTLLLIAQLCFFFLLFTLNFLRKIFQDLRFLPNQPRPFLDKAVVSNHIINLQAADIFAGLSSLALGDGVFYKTLKGPLRSAFLDRWLWMRTC